MNKRKRPDKNLTCRPWPLPTVKIASRILRSILLTLCILLSTLRPVSAQGPTQTETDPAIPLVTISRVESVDFPQVTAYVAVTGQDGEPVSGQTSSDDFNVVEDDTHIEHPLLDVTVDTTQNFNMVMALDVSTFNPRDLTQVKEAIQAFIDTLRPDDQLALIIFHDNVERWQDFSSDKEALKNAVASLEPRGTRTALHQAMLKALEVAQEPNAGRNVVVILTDKPDNVGDIASQDVIAEARRHVDIPIYSLCYSEGRQAPVLSQIDAETYGQHIPLDSPSEVEQSLLTLENWLRQGYKLTYPSTLLADDESHQLTVTHGAWASGPAAAQAHFVATSGEVTLGLSGLPDSAPAMAGVQIARGDPVTITSEVKAPGPGITVTYTWDEESRQVSTPPYALHWDSMVTPPGAYTLTVQARDSAGNKAKPQHIAFEIIEPITIEAIRLSEIVEKGDPITVAVQANTLDEIKKVSFKLNDQTLGEADTARPPYTFAMPAGATKSKDFPAGKYVLKVIIEDVAGRRQESERHFELIPTKIKIPWRSLLRIFGGLVWVAVAFLLLMFLLERQRQPVIYPLTLKNRGNVGSRYELRASVVDGPDQNLAFAFAHHNNPLPQHVIPVEGYRPKPSATMGRPASNLGPGQAVGVSSKTQAAPSSQTSTASVGSAEQSLGKAKQKAHTSATWLNTVANYLPFTRRFLSPLSNAMRQGEKTLGQAQRSSRNVQRGQQFFSSKSKETGDTGQNPHVASPSNGGSRPRADNRHVADTNYSHEAEAQSAFVPETQVWYRTLELHPNEDMKVQLHIQPPRGWHAPSQPARIHNGHLLRTYTLQVESRPIAARQALTKKSQDLLNLQRLPLYRRAFPFIVFILTLLLAVLVLAGGLVFPILG